MHKPWKKKKRKKVRGLRFSYLLKMGLDCGLTLHATLAFWKMHWNLQAKGSFFYFWYMINGFHWEMFASIFTLHPNLSTTFSSHHLYTHWCKRQSESAVERKLSSFWYAFCPDLSMFYICVTPCDYKCMGTWWQPRHFFLCLPSHCNLSLPSAEEAFITQSSQMTTSIDQNIFLYHCSSALF